MSRKGRNNNPQVLPFHETWFKYTVHTHKVALRGNLDCARQNGIRDFTDLSCLTFRVQVLALSQTYIHIKTVLAVLTIYRMMRPSEDISVFKAITGHIWTWRHVRRGLNGMLIIVGAKWAHLTPCHPYFGVQVPHDGGQGQVEGWYFITSGTALACCHS